MGVRSSLMSSSVEMSFIVQQHVDNGFDYKAYYINLDERPERRQQIEEELLRINLDFERFPAIKHKIGALGCTLSHIKALERGISTGAAHILMFEDDFIFTIVPSYFHELLNHVMQTDYDVFLLGYCYLEKKDMFVTNDKLLKKVIEASCTHGYMVNKNYASKLLENFKRGYRLKRRTHKQDHNIDLYWKKLQRNDLWVCDATGPCGIQREGYSDIDNEMKWDETTKHLLL